MVEICTIVIAVITHTIHITNILINHLREFVLNSLHPSPGASEVGLGSAALAPLCVSSRRLGINSAFYAQALYLRAIRLELYVPIDYCSGNCLQVCAVQ